MNDNCTEYLAWLASFPAALPDEVSTFRKGGVIAELSAVARYSRRVGVSEGPALMYFRKLAGPAAGPTTPTTRPGG